MTSRYKKVEVNVQSTGKGRDTGYVYIVRFGDQYKIGFTKNTPKQRLYSIQERKSQAYDDVHIIAVDDCRAAEKVLHRKFKAQRIEKEWFSLSPEQYAILSRIIAFYEGVFYTYTEARAIQSGKMTA